MWWPGRIPANKVCGELAATIDLLPTFAELSGAKTPQDRGIDGRSIVSLIEDKPDAKTPHDAYFYRTEAVRSGKWKLKGDQLYDLSADISESKNVAVANPDVALRLSQLLVDHRAELKANARPSGAIAGAKKKRRKPKK